MFPINRKVLLILALAMLLGSLPALADAAIEVAARSTVGSMTARYNSKLNPRELDRLMDKLGYRMIQQLQGFPELALWKFSGPSQNFGKAPSKNDAPQIEFLIFESRYVKDQIRIQMIYRSAKGNGDWDDVWIEPGRLMTDGYPDNPVVVDELVDVIRKQLLKKHHEELRQLFVQSAPLTAGAIWDSDPQNFRLVLPLSWDRYSSLSQSRFLLACSWPEQAAKSTAAGKGKPSAAKPPGEVELFSCGTGQRGSYSTGKQVSYQALSVEPRKWRPSGDVLLQPFEAIRGKARKLQPLRTYLTEEEPSLCSGRNSGLGELVQGDSR